jgi:hypothetical protein
MAPALRTLNPWKREQPQTAAEINEEDAMLRRAGAYMHRCSEESSTHLGRCWLAGAMLAALLSGCGGDGMDGCPVICFSDFDKPTTVAWSKTRYTIVTSPTGTEPVTLDATVRVEAFALLPTDTVLVEPNAPNQNPSPGTGIYPVVI